MRRTVKTCHNVCTLSSMKKRVSIGRWASHRHECLHGGPCLMALPGNRVQKSDAGVGIGTLVGDRDYLARKQRNWFGLPHFRFMLFGRNEIHIQAFVKNTNGKLMSSHSSSSTLHDLKILSFLSIRKQNLQNFKISKSGSIHVPTLSDMLILRFPQIIFSHIFLGSSLLFLVF